MPPAIVPLREEHFDQLRDVLDAVAREGRYLAFLQAPLRFRVDGGYADAYAMALLRP